MPSHSATPGPDPDRAPRAEHAVLVLDRAAARDLDARATSRYRIPSILLMENAARAVADEALALALAGDSQRPRVLVLCGPGNNGGDGLGAARHLHNAGAAVAVVLASPADRVRGDASIQLEIVRSMGLTFIEVADGTEPRDAAQRALDLLDGADAVIDALFGTGLDRPVTGGAAALIEWIADRHGSGTRVLAVDTPSGLDCDSGRPLGVAARADLTVTFGALKRGFLELEAQEYLGEVVVADLGLPRELVEELATVIDTRIPDADDAPEEEPFPAVPKPGDSAS